MLPGDLIPGQGFNNGHLFLFTRNKHICYLMCEFLACTKAALLLLPSLF